MPIWAEALRSVDRSPGTLVEQSKSSTEYGRYAFPDPGLFVTPASDTKKAAYLESWLQARSAWLWHVNRQSMSALSAQMWRTFLSLDYLQTTSTTTTASTTKSSKRRDQIREIMGSSLNASGIVEATSPAPVHWRGQELRKGELPSKEVVREILWELYELNFRFELFSLDRRASSLWKNSSIDPAVRQEQICSCFSSAMPASLTSINIPSSNEGLVSDDWRARLPHIIALVRVMRSWGGKQPAAFGLVGSLRGNFTEPHALELERAVAVFYTQNFFNFFGRAALLPHRITEHAM